MLRKIWRWLKQLFKGFFPSSKHKLKTQQQVPLSDIDYEFLFNQLLVGVGNGWHEGRIVKFFDQLEDRSRQKDWLEWLDRFGTKAMNSAANNQKLGAIMMQLGEKVESIPSLRKLGEKSYRLGRAILTQQMPSEIWEYYGTDATLAQTEINAFLETKDSLTEPTLELEIQEVNPEDAGEWFNLGLQQADAGKMEEAIASWDRVLALKPELDAVWHNRGAGLAQLGKFEEAIASFDKALELQPNSPQSWHDKGLALYQLKRWEQAIDSWDKLLEFSPDDYQTWYNRGCVLETIGKKEEALISYQKALEIKPDFEPAQIRSKKI